MSRITDPAVMCCSPAGLRTNSLLDGVKKQKRQMLDCVRCGKVLMMSALFQLAFRKKKKKRSGEVTALGCASVFKKTRES